MITILCVIRQRNEIAILSPHVKFKQNVRHKNQNASRKNKLTGKQLKTK